MGQDRKVAGQRGMDGGRGEEKQWTGLRRDLITYGGGRRGMGERGKKTL